MVERLYEAIWLKPLVLARGDGVGKNGFQRDRRTAQSRFKKGLGLLFRHLRHHVANSLRFRPTQVPSITTSTWVTGKTPGSGSTHPGLPSLIQCLHCITSPGSSWGFWLRGITTLSDIFGDGSVWVAHRALCSCYALTACTRRDQTEPSGEPHGTCLGV